LTPYLLIHGFAGTTVLESAMAASTEIPVELVHSSWLAAIVEEARLADAVVRSHLDGEAVARGRRHSERRRDVSFKPGELVLVEKPFFEKGQGLILPQADGPWMISEVQDARGVCLVDPIPREPAMHGARVSAGRLIKFAYPGEWLEEDPSALAENASLRVGAYYAVRAVTKTQVRVYVGRLERIFEAQEQFEMLVHEIVAGERFGPWERRPWSVKTDKRGAVLNEIVARSEVLIEVILHNKALSQSSLEQLRALGVEVTNLPHLDVVMKIRM
jgi:hypothetical protein